MSAAAGGTRPGLAIALAVVGFGALGICGLGVIALVTGDEVLAVPALGPVPGAVGFAASVVAVAAVLWGSVRRPHPSYGSAALSAIVAPLAYGAGVVTGGVLGGVDPARLVAAVSTFTLSWFSLALLVSAGIAGWVAVALVRTRAQPPRWRWEDDDDDE